MLKCQAALLCSIAVFALCVPSTFASTSYYVDFAEGDNTAEGGSPQTAWKHAPGDPNATDNPADVDLEPGDTIVFKGGVAYHGSITLEASGEPDNPIVVDGNTDGAFGEGRAILDGGQVITGWRRCESAEQAQGNPRWEDIFHADIDVDISSNMEHGEFVGHRKAPRDTQAPWQRIILTDGDEGLLPISQAPKPSDPFYPDLPGDFHESPHALTDSYPHALYYEEGTIGNPNLPLIGITSSEQGAPVIEPMDGGAVSFELEERMEIAEIGLVEYFDQDSERAVRDIAFLADGEEIVTVSPANETGQMQRFELPEPVQADTLTFRLVHPAPDTPGWTRLDQFAAFTPAGENVLEHELSTILTDEQNLTAEDPDQYDGRFIGVHGGNNHVYFAAVNEYDPKNHQLILPHFEPSTYDETRYAFYNAVRLIENPGEWAIESLGDGRSRIYLLPERVENGRPVNIGFPEFATGLSIEDGASHIEVQGFLIQRYSGGSGGVTVARNNPRSEGIRVADCEIRFLSGNAGISLNYCDDIVVENCHIHHCPGWTPGVFLSRVNDYTVRDCNLDKNSGSGIRHYECKNGVIADNAILDHFGMHASSINVYEGCEDLVLERNYIQNTAAINRSAENIVFRNNVIDGLGRASVGIGIWTSGSVGGRDIKDLHFLNNTFVNTNPDIDWSTGILGQQSGSPSSPEGLVIKNNILDGLAEDLPGEIENNIYTREVAERFMGDGCQVITDLNELFVDPENGDFRRQQGGPAMDVGADIPPPPPLK